MSASAGQPGTAASADGAVPALVRPTTSAIPNHQPSSHHLTLRHQPHPTHPTTTPSPSPSSHSLTHPGQTPLHPMGARPAPRRWR